MLRSHVPYEEGDPLFEADGWRWAYAGRIEAVEVLSYRLALLEVSTGQRREVFIDAHEMVLLDPATNTLTRYATDTNFFRALRQYEESGLPNPDP